MQEKVEIITNHFEHYWTKIPKNGYCATVRKNCSGDREIFLRSIEQFIQTAKGQNNFW